MRTSTQSRMLSVLNASWLETGVPFLGIHVPWCLVSGAGMRLLHYSLLQHVDRAPPRICPGRHLAEDFLYLVVARTMATFELCPEVRDGSPLLPQLDFIIGLVPCVDCVIAEWSTRTDHFRTPKPFNCAMEPLDGARELLLFEERESTCESAFKLKYNPGA